MFQICVVSGQFGDGRQVEIPILPPPLSSSPIVEGQLSDPSGNEVCEVPIVPPANSLPGYFNSPLAFFLFVLTLSLLLIRTRYGYVSVSVYATALYSLLDSGRVLCK